MLMSIFMSLCIETIDSHEALVTSTRHRRKKQSWMGEKSLALGSKINQIVADGIDCN